MKICRSVSTSSQWNMGWSFVVHKTSLELQQHRSILLNNSDRWRLDLNVTKQPTKACLVESKTQEAQDHIQFDLKRYYSPLILKARIFPVAVAHTLFEGVVMVVAQGYRQCLLLEGRWFTSPGLHVKESLGKILNPKLLMCWLAPWIAATTISIWITASRFGQKYLLNALNLNVSGYMSSVV